MKQSPYAGGNSKKAFEAPSTLLTVKALRSGDRLSQNAILDSLIGDTILMLDLKHSIKSVAQSSETVLICGESGTGKELIARAIHELSPCRDGPYVAVNCGALTESLLESELFGHVKGAFTGATSSKKGFFEAASGGTLFLDEFAEMSLNTQQRLLRVLQERAVRPIGSTDHREIKIDTRVVVATNHDLERDVNEGRFRRDLFYRINVLEVSAPPLRDRSDDIPLLTKHFIGKYNKKNGTKVPETIDQDALTMLKGYSWPGNVRELENVVKRLALKVSDKRPLSIADLRSLTAFSKPGTVENVACGEMQTRSSVSSRCGPCRCSEELDWYRNCLKEAGSASKAAQQLKMPRTTLRYRMMILKRKCSG